MRWEALFRDIEAQADAAAVAELEGEVADRTRAEVARVHLGDRLRAATTHPVTAGVVGFGAVEGVVAAVGAEWVLLTASGRPDALLPIAALTWLTGVSSHGQPNRDEVGSRLTLPYALRVLARDRAEVTVGLNDGTRLTGTLDRVGADFVDLAEHPAGEARRPESVRVTRTVAMAAIAAVWAA